jgi:hypothetical protein
MLFYVHSAKSPVPLFTKIKWGECSKTFCLHWGSVEIVTRILVLMFRVVLFLESMKDVQIKDWGIMSPTGRYGVLKSSGFPRTDEGG